MSVVGSISIRDNASSVLKSIRQEQTALRKDAAETRKELQRAWDKTYTAKKDGWTNRKGKAVRKNSNIPSH